MILLDRIAAVLHRARVDGGWDDETVAAKVLTEARLDRDGKQLPVEPVHTSSEIGHG